MSVLLKGFLILSFFCIITNSGNAQSNALTMQNLSAVNIDDVQDDEIKLYLLKANENGISEQNIYRILQEKGLPTSESDKLKIRIASLEGSGNKIVSSKDNIGNKIDQSNRQINQDASSVPMQKMQSDLSIFGSELFTETSLVFEPNLRIATPAGYILGPDDELIINIFGFSEKTYNLTVNQEGNIYIPQVGPVYVNGLSIEQASGKIKAKLAATIYRAINSGNTSVQISLGKIKSIRVTIIGETKKPGTYTVSSLTTLFNLLYLCGGPSDMGSYRNIELIRGNVLKRTVDLYSFLLKGDQKDNVLLSEGDVIRIPYYSKRVTLNGYVKHKGKYELIPAETFDKVLQYSGGFTDDAYKSAVTIYQLTDTERKITDLSKNQYGSYQPSSSDSIVVGKLLDKYSNKLTIAGAIQRPGAYELSSNLTLKGLIEKSGGIKEDAYAKRGGISRLNGNGSATQLSFDIDSVINNISSIPLQKNDSITIYSVFDLNNPINISIDGNVKRPGTYRWAQHLTLQDVLLTAGGLTESGDNTNIEIARRINNVNLTELNHIQTEIIVVDISTNSTANDMVLQPYDAINIRQKSGYAKQRTVFVDGMVINPGRYTLAMSGDRISEVMERAGGFRANADTTALVIKRISKKGQTLDEREKVFSKLLNIKSDSLSSSERIKDEIYKDYDKISIDLNKALHDKTASENMLLEDGDILTIEQNTNLVKVSGEVYYPTIVPFKENENLKYYIQKSGSYTDLARKNGTLVIYPDGRAKKVKHFLFFKTYPEVVSRAEIFVPQKSDKNKSKISIGEWSVVLSTLAIVANVIINLRK
jgi:protein involved in polysaccharide export with SLBB domain